MKNLTASFVLSVVAVFAARAVVLDKAYLAADIADIIRTATES